MADLDIEALVQPIGSDEPAGPDLEYDPAFSNLEIAAQRKGEQQVGDSVIEAEEPDWKVVRSQALALLERTRDLRVVWHLARAQLALEGVVGLSQAIGLAARLTEEMWPSVHPQLDPDDGDPTLRVNTLNAFADTREILLPLRHAPLAESRMVGRFSLRDYRRAHGEDPTPEGEVPPDQATIAAALTDTGADALSAKLAATDAALASARRIESVCADNIGAADSPNLEALSSLLTEIRRVLALAVPAGDGAGDGGGAAGGDEAGGPEAVPQPQAAGAAGGPAPAAGGGASASGPPGIRGRDDVVRALDLICTYYRTHEPGSPLPLLLERAKRLVHADFMAVMADLAPDGVDQARSMLGVKQESEDGY